MARITLHVHAINRLNHHNMSYLKHHYHKLNMHWALHSDVVGWISVSKQIKSHMKYVRIQNVIPDRYWHCAKYIHRPTNKFLKCSQPKKILIFKSFWTACIFKQPSIRSFKQEKTEHHFNHCKKKTLQNVVQSLSHVHCTNSIGKIKQSCNRKYTIEQYKLTMLGSTLNLKLAQQFLK